MGDFNITNDIVFEAKADAVPFNYRISYKVSLIILIMSKCCGKKGCSGTKIQMISYAITSSTARNDLFKSLNNGSDPIIIRFDPSISRAINYALYDKLIYRQGNGLFRLTEKGKEMVKKISSDKELMRSEKEYLDILSTKLTEDYIDGLSKEWGKFSAKD